MFIAAKGPVFSSGHDLKELTSAHGREHHTQVFKTSSEVNVLFTHFRAAALLSFYFTKNKFGHISR